MIYLMVDEDGLASTSRMEPSGLPDESYPTVFRIITTCSGWSESDDIEVEVNGVNGWEEVKEIES